MTIKNKNGFDGNKVTLIKTDLEENNNKFWKAWVIGSEYHVHNGRVGGKGQIQPVKFKGSESMAVKELERKARSKIKDGYRLINAVDQADLLGDEIVNPNEIIRKASAKQIRTDSPKIVLQLIDDLIEKNIHQIISSTEIQFDVELGLFKTALGFVSLNLINDARVTLDKITSRVAGGDFTSVKTKELFCDYMMMIPQKSKAKLMVETFFDSEEKILKQYSILEDLTTSVNQLDEIVIQKRKESKNKNRDLEIPHLFDCDVNIEKDNKIIDKITEFFNKHKRSYHHSSNMKISRVFRVGIDKHTSGFQEKEMASEKNVWELWHGTRAGNVVSILKNGFVIPPANAAHCVGRMFGNGAYFSNNSTKSLNYATGYWGGGKSTTSYMFLCDVAMGDYFVPTESDSSLHEHGHDSIYAKAKVSSVANNEMIVFDLDRIKVKYLVEFKSN